jgi:hypothetical protein
MLIKEGCPCEKNAYIIKIVQAGGYPGQHKESKSYNMKYYGNSKSIFAAKP